MRRSVRFLLPSLAAAAASVTAACESLDGGSCGVERFDTEKTITAESACADLVRANDDFIYYQSNADGGSLETAFCSTLCAGGESTNCGAGVDFFRNSTIGTREYNDAGSEVAVAEDGGSLTAQSGYTQATCPVVDAFKVSCVRAVICGRHTEGAVKRDPGGPLGLGAYFAELAYLEAVSVFAFDRIADELYAFDAPATLVAEAKRAATEEISHTVEMERLARAHGFEPLLPGRPDFAPRSLFDFAMENAIEGCARETFGATIGILQAERATSRDVRNAMRSIAKDECGHADLSWRIAAWVRTQLSAEENIALETATRDALRDMRNVSHVAPSDADRLIGYVSPAERRALVAQLEAHLPWSVAA